MKSIEKIDDFVDAAKEHGSLVVSSSDMGKEAHIGIATRGDGWVDKYSEFYGLSKQENGNCCETSREKRPDSVYCEDCGAGINGSVQVYRGKFENHKN